MATSRFIHTADWHLGTGFGALPKDVAVVRLHQHRGHPHRHKKIFYVASIPQFDGKDYTRERIA